MQEKQTSDFGAEWFIRGAESCWWVGRYVEPLTNRMFFWLEPADRDCGAAAALEFTATASPGGGNVAVKWGAWLLTEAKTSWLFIRPREAKNFSINPRCGPPVGCGNLRTDGAAVIEATGAAVVTGTRATLLARGTTSTGSSSVCGATTDGSLRTNPDCSRCGVETEFVDWSAAAQIAGCCWRHRLGGIVG